jgi:hypothetical protein
VRSVKQGLDRVVVERCHARDHTPATAPHAVRFAGGAARKG